MARKNKNAGQPNRAAQSARRSTRIDNAKRYDYRRSDVVSIKVFSPGSENLSTKRKGSELQEVHEYLVNTNG